MTKYGMLEELVTDRDTRSSSIFWDASAGYVGIGQLTFCRLCRHRTANLEAPANLFLRKIGLQVELVNQSLKAS